VFRAGADGDLPGLLTSVASAGRADVLGLFLEDNSLFRLAELPFAIEICRMTTVVRRLTTRDLERQMSVLALRAEQAVRRAAEASGSRWSFRKYRGRLASALAEASEVDYLLLGAAQNALASLQNAQLGFESRLGREADLRRPVAVVFDRSDGAERALDAGIALAEKTGRHLVVFVSPELETASALVYDRLAALGATRATLRGVTHTDPSHLTSELRRALPAVLVVGVDRTGVDAERVRTLQHRVRCPMILVR